MAVPDTLTAWRAFVAHHPVQPPTLTPRRLASLSPAATADYHRQRIAWLAADIVLETPHITALERQMRILLARNDSYTATARRGLALSGAAGLGKSTAALLIGKRHERRMRDQTNRDGPNYAPVVYIVAPPGATPKILMLAFATWLGLITHPRATAQHLTDQVVAVLRDLGTTLVIVDEVHNLHTNNPAGAQAASALKVFSERLDATFCYVGIDLPTADLYTGDMGRQIKARTILHEIGPYTHTTADGRDQWTALILGLEALLPLRRHRRGTLARHATYLHDRTGGSIGSLRALLADAAIAAIQEHTERIDRPLLESIPTDRAATEHHTDLQTHRPTRPPAAARR
ncbi:TniB family NTP-binding protein [Mycolicibacterium austroafricanum]|uniref:TniB family NTP-binding protein n=1 Tax=Mycolicibacterium austroafricanum TaxID=39687 RepID=A0ABT8H8U1_MYCAO|nr:TniB family NTP-binding protein [Mycolicibacterium austroafricanum]MDN4517182.1 TniB family NTP-binding protein [Mycolicibacterium austroafricanum]